MKINENTKNYMLSLKRILTSVDNADKKIASSILYGSSKRVDTKLSNIFALVTDELQNNYFYLDLKSDPAVSSFVSALIFSSFDISDFKNALEIMNEKSLFLKQASFEEQINIYYKIDKILWDLSRTMLAGLDIDVTDCSGNTIFNKLESIVCEQATSILNFDTDDTENSFIDDFCCHKLLIKDLCNKYRHYYVEK